MRLSRAGGLLLLFIAGCLAPPDTETSSAPIIGGAASGPGDYPATGVLLSVYDFGGGQSFGSMTCTGTLIAPDVVLMAAHCTLDFFGGSIPFTNYFSFELDVSGFGMETMTLPADAVEFVELVPHPDFDINTQPPPGLNNYNDVGIGFLSQEVLTVTPAVVADAQDAPRLVVGAEVAIVGYGQRDPNVQEAGIKHQALTFINEVNQHEMQIGDMPPDDPQKCHGDSGGPTFLDVDDGRAPLRRLIGITSRAYDQSDCNKGGVDMRADAFRDWLNQTMQDRCASGARPSSVCANGGGLPIPGGQVPPPPDAGILDTGQDDAGVTPPEDAGTTGPDDAGMDPAVDAGSSPAPDAGTPTKPATGGGSRRDRDGRGCGCNASDRAGGAPHLLAGLLALLLMRRRRVSAGAAAPRE